MTELEDRMNHRVRIANEADLLQLAEIHVASWQDAFRGVVPDTILDGMSVAASLKRWIKNFAACPANIAVALGEDGEIAGFCCAGPITDGDDWEQYPFRVFALHIRPQKRGRGIGSALLDDALDRAAHRKGLHTAILWTLEALVRTRRFYEREGGVLVKKGLWQIDGIALPEVAYAWQLPRASAKGSRLPAGA